MITLTYLQSTLLRYEVPERFGGFQNGGKKGDKVKVRGKVSNPAHI